MKLLKMKTKSDIIFDIINYSFLAVIFFAAFYPLYFVVIASFSDPTYVNAGETLFLPKGFTLAGYEKAFEYKKIWIGYKNSAIYTLIGTCINLAVLIPASFALSRKELVGRKIFTTLMLFTMYFSGGTIPVYLLIKNLGLMDTMWALVLPGAFSVYNMIICRSYFQGNVSEELFESVKLDGGGYMRFFFSVVLPLSKAIIAVMVLYHALGHWNVYVSALYYLRDGDKYPLQLVLANLTNSLTNSMVDGGLGADTAETEKLREMIRYSTILIAALPMIILYPFVQKYFVTGVMIGSVKG
ncbi:MAG: carbohydrate ABC transporter permease [Clostridia bacterium]|nr:carbohydrate ABC transporter permease [Clostridia bacterium]